MHGFRDSDSDRYRPLRQHGILKWPISTAPKHIKVYNFIVYNLKVNISIVKHWKQLVSSL